ncbi:hypothetical protein HK101_011662 [Irineochytrium annulatum]|nr:hypothetical protein HK101_011662 [Irineochytrium annulatum]
MIAPSTGPEGSPSRASSSTAEPDAIETSIEVTGDTAAADHTAPTRVSPRRIFVSTMLNVLRLIIVNIALPSVIYYVASTPLHLAATWSILLSGVPPTIEAVVVMVVRKKVDILAGSIIIGLIVSFVIVMLSNDPRLLILKDSCFTLVNGVAFLVSVRFNENLLWYYNRTFAGWGNKAAQDSLTAQWNEGPWVRWGTNIVCYAWGITYLLEAAARVVMVYTLPLDFVVYISPWVFAGVSTVLGTTTTQWLQYRARKRRRLMKQARLAAEVEEGDNTVGAEEGRHVEAGEAGIGAEVGAITIQVPASTANIGPGFDVLGMALGKHLVLKVTIPAPDNRQGIIVSYEGDSASTVPLSPSSNLITRTAIQVAACHSKSLPPSVAVHIINPIPLGRGLGSSGSAVVAGVALASEACGLKLSIQRVLDYCMAIEGHPDNITASILGGFVGSYVRSDVDPGDEHEQEGDDDIYPGVKRLLTPKEGLATHVKLRISQRVRAVVVIPQFEVATKLARSVLPPTYSRADVVFNLQRVAVLCSELGQDEPRPDVVSDAMRDMVHQKYRQHLVPGLAEILQLSPAALPGLLGTCLSGAGPTVLALATSNFEEIGRRIVDVFARGRTADGKAIEAKYEVLDITDEGLSVTVE